jgi:hypothetical protein
MKSELDQMRQRMDEAMRPAKRITIRRTIIIGSRSMNLSRNEFQVFRKLTSVRRVPFTE